MLVSEWEKSDARFLCKSEPISEPSIFRLQQQPKFSYSNAKWPLACTTEFLTTESLAGVVAGNLALFFDATTSHLALHNTPSRFFVVFFTKDDRYERDNKNTYLEDSTRQIKAIWGLLLFKSNMNQEQTDAELKAQARGPRRSMQAAEQDLAGVHHLTSSQESPSTASKTADEPPVTTSSSPPTSGGTNPVTTDTISRLERDVSAKQQAAAGASSSSIIKPGAVHVVPTTADPDEGLEPPTLERGTSMDARIKARNRPLRAGSSQARRRSNSSSGQQQVTNSQASSVHRLEADVATKMNILNNGGSASSNAASSNYG